MHISFTKHDPNISTSCKAVIEYLEKENNTREKKLEHYFDGMSELYENKFDDHLEKQNKFFSNVEQDKEEKFFSQIEATDTIDANSSSRHKESQSNFFMINVSPSKQEIDHLKKIIDIELNNKGIGEKEQFILAQTDQGNNQLEIMKNDLMHQALREYSREVMQKYVENFNRTIYINPDKLPNQKEEKNINSETKLELNNQGIDKNNPNYEQLYQQIRENKAKLLGKDLSVRKMTEKDLVWFGKVEEKRTYKSDDKWVKDNKSTQKEIDRLDKIVSESSKKNKERLEKIVTLEKRLHRDKVTGDVVREGMKKGGDQYHVHIIVSRYDNCPDKRFKGSMSPMANHKNSKIAGKNAQVGFNRDEFFKQTEKSFDQKFHYERPQKEKYEQRNFERKNYDRTGQKLSNAVKRTGTEILQPLKNEVMRNTGMNEISKLNISNNVSKELGFRVPMSIPKTPMEASIKLIRSTIQKISEVSKGI
ncbi:hypothetical protein D1631_00095 [Chryseobacterium nematophagum]|uniref:Mobilization protein n=1 Tax=Chryseobacterium nematophagum TaxID=2305228 RepID=A0A3M7TLK7_9FLAO|nr:DUF5712 family protein [Chryseobacterium nematophagum]RNA63946.1 hypothetical protein D1631_00095 [Chryseobacterium nematophagum]